MSQGAIVDTSGSSGGAIKLQGRNLILSGDSQVFSTTSESENGGNLVINATDSINLSGNNTAIYTFTSGSGAAGNLTVVTKKLTVEGGAYITTSTQGEGRAGDLQVNALESIELTGTTSVGELSSGLGSQVCPILNNCESVTGNGGNLTIETRRLLIQDGARIDASTFGTGRGGNVLVRASDSVELIGASQSGLVNSGIFTQVGNGAIANAGDAGNLTIETQRLIAMKGGAVSSATFSYGNAGTLIINALNSIELNGTSSSATLTRGSSGIFVSAEPKATGNVGNLNIRTKLLTVENGAKISADNFGTGQPGSMTLNVDKLAIRNGGLVRAGSFDEGSGGTLTVNAALDVEINGTGTIGSDKVNSTLTISSQGTGQAGDLKVTARSVKLDNQGKLIGESASTDGGNITLNLRELLLLRRNSQISTTAGTAQAGGNGGNITIDASNGFIVADTRENSDITANAFTGRGGNVNIRAQGIFGIEPRLRESPQTSDITASSETGIQGQISINDPDVEPAQGLIELPEEVVDATRRVAQICPREPGAKPLGEFTITGRGSLPPSPLEPLPGATNTTKLATLDDNNTNVLNIAPNKVQNAIVEAQGWVKNNDGSLELVAMAPNSTLMPRVVASACPDN
ncbi:hypothetical protein CAL7716_104190 (plasmid) [Calothrix sp. PCC 7716]|nr:hypothetical protein CAL7716_104190 [Calothrix sp. PCC 7716]